MQRSRVIPKISPILVHGKLVFHKNLSLGPKRLGAAVLQALIMSPSLEPHLHMLAKSCMLSLTRETAC